MRTYCKITFELDVVCGEGASRIILSNNLMRVSHRKLYIFYRAPSIWCIFAMWNFVKGGESCTQKNVACTHIEMILVAKTLMLGSKFALDLQKLQVKQEPETWWLAFWHHIESGYPNMLQWMLMWIWINKESWQNCATHGFIIRLSASRVIGKKMIRLHEMQN